MCGLFGVIAPNFTRTHLHYFNHLMMQSYIRGVDATGVLSIHKKENKKTNEEELYFLRERSNDDCLEFLRKEYNSIKKKKFSILTIENQVALLGHVRAATKGSKKIENAHPFLFSKLIGFHNGTVHKGLPIKPNYGTDSEEIFHYMNDNGLQDTLDILEDSYTDPSYAFVFFNRTEMTVNFIRNKARPLYLGFSKNCIVYASQEEFIEHLMNYWQNVYFDIQELPVHEHVSIPIENMDSIEDIIKGIKKEKIIVKKKTKTTTKSSGVVVRPGTTPHTAISNNNVIAISNANKKKAWKDQRKLPGFTFPKYTLPTSDSEKTSTATS